MIRIIATISILLFIATAGHAQILKGAGIIYFDSLTNVNASTSGAEIAFSIKQKALYKWNRTTSEWDLVVKDTSAFNELQVLYKVGDTLYLTDQITGVSLKPYKNRLHLIATLADTTSITDEVEGDVAYVTGGDTLAFRDSLYWLPFFVEAYTDPDPDPTNELQEIDTLSLSGTILNASLSSDGVAAKTVDLSPLLTGYVSGSLTAGRIPRATAATTIVDGVLRDDGTLLAIGGATVSGYSFYDYSTGAWRLATGTTAQRPTNIAGLLRYNTSLGYSETANGSTWRQSDFPAGTTSYTLRYDGTSWVANSFIFNTGSAVGINDATPTAQLDLTGWFRLGGDGNDGSSIGIGQRNSNTNGSGNVSLGDENNTNTSSTGNLNVRIGKRAGYAVTTGDENVQIGSNAGRFITTGSYNLCIGAETGMQFLATRGIITGSSNLLFGYRAAYDIIQSGVTQGIFLGNESGAYASQGTNCIFLGYQAGKDNNRTAVIAIGNGSQATANNQIVIGDANGSYTQLKSRNYAFNIDQTVGAGQDGYALKYNHSTGEIELATVGSGTITGSGSADYITKFTGASAIGNSVIQESSGKIGIGASPSHILDMEAATDAVDMPGGTTAQRPTNESELLRYNSDNARMEYADGTNWRDLLPATGTTGSIILPSGTTAQRDGSPANGYMRYNTSTGQLEAYVQSAWANISASPRSYADMVGSGAAQYTVVGTEVIDTVTNIVAVGFTHSNGVLTYTGTTNKNFLVNISAVVGEADTDAATAVLRLYQNSTIKGVTQQYCALQDEKYAVSISRIVTLATNDTLDCRLATGGDWIVSNFYFNVTPID